MAPTRAPTTARGGSRGRARARRSTSWSTRGRRPTSGTRRCNCATARSRRCRRARTERPTPSPKWCKSSRENRACQGRRVEGLVGQVETRGRRQAKVIADRRRHEQRDRRETPRDPRPGPLPQASLRVRAAGPARAARRAARAAAVLEQLPRAGGPPARARGGRRGGHALRRRVGRVAAGVGEHDDPPPARGAARRLQGRGDLPPVRVRLPRQRRGGVCARARGRRGLLRQAQPRVHRRRLPAVERADFRLRPLRRRPPRVGPPPGRRARVADRDRRRLLDGRRRGAADGHRRAGAALRRARDGRRGARHGVRGPGRPWAGGVAGAGGRGRRGGRHARQVARLLRRLCAVRQADGEVPDQQGAQVDLPPRAPAPRRGRRHRGARAATRAAATGGEAAAQRARAARGARRVRLARAGRRYADRAARGGRRPRHRGGERARARARHLRPGDPAADGGPRHLAAAAGGDGLAHEVGAARGGAGAGGGRAGIGAGGGAPCSGEHGGACRAGACGTVRGGAGPYRGRRRRRWAAARLRRAGGRRVAPGCGAASSYAVHRPAGVGPACGRREDGVRGPAGRCGAGGWRSLAPEARAGRTPPMHGLFVTGTDTGVGKTVVAAAICAAVGEEVAAFKPVVTGLDHPPGEWPHDHVLLARAAGGRQTPEDVAPYRFGPPVSPHYAAELSDETIEPARIVAAARAHERLVCEGVGGLMVPITTGYLVRDLAVDLGLPLLIAARTGLGTINHTLLTVEAARAAGLTVAGVVMTPWPSEPDLIERSNPDTIERLAGGPVHGLPPTDPDSLPAPGRSLPLHDWL